MTQIDRRALIRTYKETPRPAGVYRVRNVATGKSLVGSTADLPGMMNRQRFDLENGSHLDTELQRDWDELGSDSFEFETLDRLEPKDDPGYDLREDLRVLQRMWVDKLTECGESLYERSRRGI